MGKDNSPIKWTGEGATSALEKLKELYNEYSFNPSTMSLFKPRNPNSETISSGSGGQDIPTTPTQKKYWETVPKDIVEGTKSGAIKAFNYLKDTPGSQIVADTVKSPLMFAANALPDTVNWGAGQAVDIGRGVKNFVTGKGIAASIGSDENPDVATLEQLWDNLSGGKRTEPSDYLERATGRTIKSPEAAQVYNDAANAIGSLGGSFALRKLGTWAGNLGYGKANAKAVSQGVKPIGNSVQDRKNIPALTPRSAFNLSEEVGKEMVNETNKFIAPILQKEGNLKKFFNRGYGKVAQWRKSIDPARKELADELETYLNKIRDEYGSQPNFRNTNPATAATAISGPLQIGQTSIQQGTQQPWWWKAPSGPTKPVTMESLMDFKRSLYEDAGGSSFDKLNKSKVSKGIIKDLANEVKKETEKIAEENLFKGAGSALAKKNNEIGGYYSGRKSMRSRAEGMVADREGQTLKHILGMVQQSVGGVAGKTLRGASIIEPVRTGVSILDKHYGAKPKKAPEPEGDSFGRNISN